MKTRVFLRKPEVPGRCPSKGFVGTVCTLSPRNGVKARHPRLLLKIALPVVYSLHGREAKLAGEKGGPARRGVRFEGGGRFMGCFPQLFSKNRKKSRFFRDARPRCVIYVLTQAFSIFPDFSGGSA
jgi:hypothetical protein